MQKSRGIYPCFFRLLSHDVFRGAIVSYKLPGSFLYYSLSLVYQVRKDGKTIPQCANLMSNTKDVLHIRIGEGGWAIPAHDPRPGT